MRFTTAEAFYAHVEKHGPVFPDSLNLTGCTSLAALPDGLSVGGWLNLTGCTSLAALPDGLSVGGWLALPDHLCGPQVWHGTTVRLQNIDGYTMVMEGRVRHPGGRVWRARYIRTRAVADMPKCFIAKVGDHYAHGKTADEAVQDAAFKALECTDADEIVEGIRARGVVTAMEFRALTGACIEGLRHGLQERGVDPKTDRLPIADALRLARGNAYGDRFIELVGEAP